jgi:hypothetical protein
MRGRRDYVAIALATAGVLAAVSLAGIFVVYLIDTINGDDTTTTQVAGATSPTSPGPTAATGASPGTGASPPDGGATPGGAAAGGAGGGGAGGGAGGAGGGGRRANRIPDNQQYETFTARSAGYSISRPKGWTDSGSNKDKSFNFRLDFLHVVSSKGGKPTVESLRNYIKTQKQLKIVSPPQEVKVDGQDAIKATVLERRKREGLATASIFIDQYRMAKGNRVVAVDLGCPAGVYEDNSDDFRRMIESFRFL